MEINGLEARQNQIKRVLEHYCRSHNHKRGLPRLYRLQVIESPKIVFCMVPKVASRQWRSLLQEVRLQKKQFRTNLGQYKSANISDYLTKSFKFMFVREPFERLLSAYKDKFVFTRDADRYMLDTYGRNIIRKFRPNATRRALLSGDDVSFPEFVEYIIKEGVQEGLNWHWNTYENQCRPCSVDYDYIGRYETLAQDAEFVLKKAGVFNLTKFPRVHYSSTKSELLKYYAQIPPQWITHLGQIYRSSFEMFRYPFPGPLENLFLNATTP